MRAFGPVALILALAGCTGGPQPPAVAPGPDTCHAAQHAALVGRPASALAKAGLVQPYRVLTPDSAVTQDYSPARLNIHVDAAGRIARLVCG